MMRYLFITGLILTSNMRLQAAEEASHDEARLSFQRGVEAFEEGRVSEALIAFQRAYTLRPSYRILYNIGQAQTELGLTLQAVDSFEKYLAEGGSTIPTDRVFEVENELRRLKAVANIKEIDEAPPAAPEPADLMLKKEREPEQVNKFVTVGLPWLSTGLAVASLTGAAISATKVSTLNESLNKACESGICPPGREGDIKSMKRLAITADVLFAATTVLATTAVALFVAARKKKKRAQQ